MIPTILHTDVRTRAASPQALRLAGMALAAAASMLALPPIAGAQTADAPPKPQRPATAKAAPREGKVLGGMQRGTDAAGRSIDHADHAARSGIERASESASRPIRNFGESLGRKLPGGGSGRSAPAVGPQGNAP